MLEHSVLAGIAVGMCFVALSWRELLVMRNIFLVYTFAIYLIAPIAYDERPSATLQWGFEYLLVAAVFLLGYHWTMAARGRAKRRTISPDRARWLFRRAHRVLIGLILCNVMFLAVVISSIGIRNYYAGMALVELIRNYGKANTQGAIFQVATFSLGIFATVGTAVLAELAALTGDQNQPRRTPEVNAILRTAACWFVLFPVLQFSRSALVYGGLAYLALRERVTGRRPLTLYLSVGASAIAFFIYVGTTRARALGETEFRPLGFFSAELEPWAAYRDLRENMFRLHYQYGKPLVIPLLLHVIPRGLYPDKPQNSAGYVAQTLNPIAFENGFAVPATFAGDLYLNFGIIGVVFGTLFLGSYAGRLDRIAVRGDREHAGLFILAFGSFPSLLRDSLSSTLFTVATWLIVYWFFSLLARDRLRL